MTPEEPRRPDVCKQLDELLKEAGLVVKIGLRQQGHFDKVTAWRNDFQSWAFIAAQIGWAPVAVQDSYELECRLELAAQRAEGEALRQELATLRQTAMYVVTVANAEGGHGYRLHGLINELAAALSPSLRERPERTEL